MSWIVTHSPVGPTEAENCKLCGVLATNHVVAQQGDARRYAPMCGPCTQKMVEANAAPPAPVEIEEPAAPEPPKGPIFAIPAGTRISVCRGCGFGIYWIVTVNQRRMPVNADGVSHFATCPEANGFRGRGRAE